MSFLDDASQENIDQQIAVSKVEYDIHAYETQILDSKRKLAECKKVELAIKSQMAKVQALLADKNKELKELMTLS